MRIATQHRARGRARAPEAAQIRGGARPFIDFAQRRHVHLGTLMGSVNAHPKQLGSPHQWIPYRTLRRLLLNARQIFGDPEVAFQIGLESMRDTGLGLLQPLVPAVPGHLGLAPALRQLSLSLGTTYRDLEVIGSGRAGALILLARYRTEMSPLLGDCLYLRGAIAGVATRWDHARGIVREQLCSVDIVTVLREEFAVPAARDLHFEDGLLFLGEEQIGRRVLLATEELEDPAPERIERLWARPPQPLPRISAPVPGNSRWRQVTAPQVRDRGTPPHEIDPDDPGAAVLLTRDVIAGQAPDSVVLEAGRIFNAACCRYEVTLIDQGTRGPGLARAFSHTPFRAFFRHRCVRQGLMGEMIAQMEENSRRAERISALNLQLEARYQEVERTRQALLNINEHLQLQLHRRGEALTQVRSELDLSKEHLDRLLERLHQTEVQLIHQGKMAALGQLVAGISHELRTPIQAIVSHSRNLGTIAERILADLTALPAELGKRLGSTTENQARTFIKDGAIGRLSKHLTSIPRSLEASAHQINDLINSLRQFSRTDESVRATVHLRDMLQDTLRIASVELARRVDVSVDLADELPPIHCSPSQINQVFLSMLVNAAQAVRPCPSPNSTSVSPPGRWPDPLE